MTAAHSTHLVQCLQRPAHHHVQPSQHNALAVRLGSRRVVRSRQHMHALPDARNPAEHAPKR